MTIGIPFDLSFQNSNVTDPSHTLRELLSNCQAPVFQTGLEVQAGEWVYTYEGLEFTPRVWNAGDEAAGKYNMDEILLKGCSLVKVTGKSGTGITTHQRPKEPDEYGCHDTNIDPATWKCRYFKFSAALKCGWLTKVWTLGSIKYNICWDSCKDNYNWVVTDTRSPNGCGTARWPLSRSSKFTTANDKKAVLFQWGASGQGKQSTIRFMSMIERQGYFYLRTNINAPLEYHTWTTGTAFSYSYMTVKSPADIDGFKQLRRVQAHNPFDGKNYTQSRFDTGKEGYARWDMLVNQDIDSIALGRVICDTIDFRVSDERGKSLFELNSYPVDNTIAPGRDEVYPSTIILYTDKTYPPGSVVTVKLNAPVVTIGELVGASKLSAGFTKLAFKNKFKDFSPKDQDQWGNWYYKDGIRVHIHSGTVEYPVVSYDQLNRLMIMIGGQKVLINSSDTTKNEVPDGRHAFEATMMIARFTSFELSTAEKNKRIGERATYSFSVEELV